jgi:hypothetical protein
MAVTHPSAIRTILADTVVDSIDVGGAGSLIFDTSGDVEVATLTFATPAFNAASGPTAAITTDSITSDTDAAGGIVAKFRMTNGSAADAGFLGVVLTSGGDINLSSLDVGVGDTVSMSDLSYTASP